MSAPPRYKKNLVAAEEGLKPADDSPSDPQPQMLACLPGIGALMRKFGVTEEFILLGILAPPLLIVPFLLFRLVVYVLRLFLGKRQLPERREDRTLTEQLGDNWDDLSGGYRAGQGKYASVWTRDSFFGMFAPVPERGARLTIFVDRLRDNMTPVFKAGPFGYGRASVPRAHCPFQFNETHYMASTMRDKPVMRAKPIVLYRDEKYGQPVMDVNAQYVIMVSEAYLISRDLDWLATHAHGIRQALAFYELYTDEEGLVHELPFGNWEDSLLFTGARAFTNLMYLEALRRAKDMLSALGQHAERPEAAAEILEAADEYSATIDKVYEPVFELLNTQRDTMSIGLAAFWFPAEGRINQWIGEMLADGRPDTMPVNRWPIPPESECSTILRILGQGGYHLSFRWAHVGCCWAAALLERGFREEGVAVLERFERAVERFGTVHEVFDADDENPVSRAMYGSETQFSMGIGMYLYAQARKGGDIEKQVAAEPNGHVTNGVDVPVATFELESEVTREMSSSRDDGEPSMV